MNYPFPVPERKFRNPYKRAVIPDLQQHLVKEKIVHAGFFRNKRILHKKFVAEGLRLVIRQLPVCIRDRQPAVVKDHRVYLRRIRFWKGNLVPEAVHHKCVGIQLFP